MGAGSAPDDQLLPRRPQRATRFFLAFFKTTVTWRCSTIFFCPGIVMVTRTAIFSEPCLPSSLIPALVSFIFTGPEWPPAIVVLPLATTTWRGLCFGWALVRAGAARPRG